MEQLKTDFEDKAITLFEDDLKLAREFRVRGFPTMSFIDNVGNEELVFGTKPYAFYKMAILKMNPSALKSVNNKNQKTLFSKYNTLTAKEFSELSGTPREESEQLLNELSDKSKISNAAIS